MKPSTPTHLTPPKNGQGSSVRAAGFLCVIIVGVFLASLLNASVPPPAVAQESSGDTVVVIPVHGTIEPGLGHFLDRAIGEAEDLGARAIILDLNTPGGRLDTVLEMRDRIMDTEVPVVAYVDREAFSAGALITIASDDIWMAPGAVFGAATPVVGGTGETADAKTISAVRSVFRATAEENGRDPLIAEAMVDPAIAIEGLDTSSSLLTLTTAQALEHGYAEGIAPTSTTLLQELGFGNADVIEMEMNFWEQAVRWVTDPVVASLLILLGMALIVIDGLVGGFGVVAAAGLVCLGFFFWGHSLAGLAGWEDLVLIVIGLALIGLEIFVIPGFGIAGIGGVVALIAGFAMAMTRRDIGDEGFAQEAGEALMTVVVTLLVTTAVIVAFAWTLPRIAPQSMRPARGLQRLSLGATVDEGGSEPSLPGWLTRMFGGDETVGRDDEGHTAISLRERDGREARGSSWREKPVEKE